MVPRAPDACWRALVDAHQLTGWVPGLRRARVVSTEPSGLPSEIVFEFSQSRTYSLAYEYDLGQGLVRWEPRTGKRDGVRGFARVEAADGGTRLTYALEHGVGRTASDLALGDVDELADAFVRWVVRAATA